VRYVFYGAGAIGGTLGARLFETGREVVFIARGDHGRAIAAHGLRFGTPEGWRTLRIPVAAHPDELTFSTGDVVVLAMKSQDTTSALTALMSRAPAGLHVVCAQNGVANERRALRRFANTHGMCVLMAGVHLEPGVVHQHNPPMGANCDIGGVPRGVDDVDAAFAADLIAAGVRSSACADVMARKYAKLILNLLNVLEAASGREAYASDLGRRARAEAEAVFAAAGIQPRTEEPAGAGMRFADVAGVSRPGGSTFQSLVRGATTLEADDLNGEIVLLGRLHDIPTPVNAMLQRLALRLVAEQIPPGSMPLADLEEAATA
jgi:2-dehydropantoate 2-reductase